MRQIGFMVLGMVMAAMMAWGISALDSPAFSKADRLPVIYAKAVCV